MKCRPKLLILIMAVILSAFAGCNGRPDPDQTQSLPVSEGKSYTYRTYATALGDTWNPHTWETSADDDILQWLETPLVDLSILDSQKGTYQWVFKAATAITDVTASRQADLIKYGAHLPAGKTAADITEGYVYEIQLNPHMKWENGTPIDADTYIYSMKALLDPEMRNYRANSYYAGDSAIAGALAYYNSPSEEGETLSYDDTVGCYKVDDYTIRYVCQSYYDYNYFLNSCTSNWLVYEDLYEKGKEKSGMLVTTNYGTSKETTMSYGPYRIESLQKGKQIVYVQNENYYGFEKQPDGTLYGETDWLVDGKRIQIYQTTKVVVDVITNEAAKQAFLKGQLTTWSPPADQVANYAHSEQMYKTDETYTMSLFFHTDLENLRRMDQSKGNTNSVVVSNHNFRKAMSLAIDRSDWVKTTQGYKPAYTLLNDLYHYDIYNDPHSAYRASQAAMAAICELYGAKYGPGMPYATLEQAYRSINGYNLTQAKRLMKTACEELVAAGLYKAGEPIRIRVAYAKGALEAAVRNQMDQLNLYLNAAVEGSGFGRITLEPVGNIPDRYSDTAAGEYAIGYGAWGGAALYPFGMMQLYCDPAQNRLHEGGSWDPASELLTIQVNGEAVTMTWQAWSNAMEGVGAYATADLSTKLRILATMEKEFLAKYYRIPLASSIQASLLSYQARYYTDRYNLMYGFGGFELLTYYCTDGQWADYVKRSGGTLRYE